MAVVPMNIVVQAIWTLRSIRQDVHVVLQGVPAGRVRRELHDAHLHHDEQRGSGKAGSGA